MACRGGGGHGSSREKRDEQHEEPEQPIDECKGIFGRSSQRKYRKIKNELEMNEKALQRDEHVS